ncbi:guanylate kinase [Halothiobacillus sp. DCM-1]|uniref:guanylate kinase n=1 Tax=Halothiobacillus sp. DCM-1 TaxID=3112558 RepID=UPI00324FF35C
MSGLSATGQLFVVSAPSGAGKTSLIKALRMQQPQLGLSVSHTTRPMRPGEVNGQHYHFVTTEVFRQMRAEGAFIEHAEVFGNYYGTSRAAVEAVLAAGQDVILEIDWQGAAQVRSQFPSLFSVFILPPDLAALRARLEGRGQDAAAVIERRLSEAQREMREYAHYDYLIINDDFDQALAELAAVFTAARLRTPVQAVRQAERLENLLNTPHTP